MYIAIIEDNLSYQNALRNKLKNKKNSWKIDFFECSTSFKLTNFFKYDVIISSYNIPFTNGQKLLEFLQNKTKADLALMSSKCEWVTDSIIKNKRIKAIIDKKKPQNVINWLKYMESRKLIDEFNVNLKKTFESCVSELKTIKKTSNKPNKLKQLT